MNIDRVLWECANILKLKGMNQSNFNEFETNSIAFQIPIKLVYNFYLLLKSLCTFNVLPLVPLEAWNIEQLLSVHIFSFFELVHRNFELLLISLRKYYMEPNGGNLNPTYCKLNLCAAQFVWSSTEKSYFM